MGAIAGVINLRRDDEIIINCKHLKDAKRCTAVLDSILNKGEAIVSMDYMDFINKSGVAKYELDLLEGIDLNNYRDCLGKIEIADNRKYIICIVGKVSLADVTDIANIIINAKEALFTYIYDDKCENKFDMFLWKEI